MQREESSLGSASTSSDRFLTLTLGDELYGIDILQVREILDMTEITRIPRTPAFMRGVVNVRGQAVPVVDLRSKFGMSETVTTLNTRIVILEIERESSEIVPFGAIADSVRDVIELSQADIADPPSMGASVNVEFISGIARVADDFLILLNINRVFSLDELNALGRTAVADNDAEKDAGSEDES